MGRLEHYVSLECDARQEQVQHFLQAAKNSGKLLDDGLVAFAQACDVSDIGNFM